MPPLRLTLAIALILLLAGCSTGVKPGQPAPEFRLPGPSGPVTLADYRGHVLVLNFWATWCPPCVGETPSLNALQQEFPDHSVEILGVSIDTDAAAYRQFLAQYQVRYSTALDPAADVPTRYGTKGWPETYIIDPRGVVRRKLIGPLDWTSPEMVGYLRDLAKKRG